MSKITLPRVSAKKEKMKAQPIHNTTQKMKFFEESVCRAEAKPTGIG
jgi:hypothetical protein